MILKIKLTNGGCEAKIDGNIRASHAASMLLRDLLMATDWEKATPESIADAACVVPGLAAVGVSAVRAFTMRRDALGGDTEEEEAVQRLVREPMPTAPQPDESVLPRDWSKLREAIEARQDFDAWFVTTYGTSPTGMGRSEALRDAFDAGRRFEALGTTETAITMAEAIIKLSRNLASTSVDVIDIAKSAATIAAKPLKI